MVKVEGDCGLNCEKRYKSYVKESYHLHVVEEYYLGCEAESGSMERQQQM